MVGTTGSYCSHELRHDKAGNAMHRSEPSEPAARFSGNRLENLSKTLAIDHQNAEKKRKNSFLKMNRKRAKRAL